MTVVVFAGPTIPASDIAAVIEAVVLPPVSMGDVYRCGRMRPRAIGIIDGYFEGVPSVWHKEILWAIDRGIAVFGAASMGALRAAELHLFGMRGVGKIFEAFRDGVLEDDDEVALQHGPAEIGYIPLSEPMVNIRATLDHAVWEGILGREFADRLSAMAKECFYPERNWRALIEHASADGLRLDALSGLATWLPEGRVDQKRLDALAMLQAMEAFRREGSDAIAAGYRLEWTTMWADAISDIEAMDRRSGDASAIVDELRHDAERFRAVRRRAAARLLAGRTGANGQGSGGARNAARATMRFRSERNLFTQAALDRWLAQNDLDKAGFEQLIESEARLTAIEADAALGHHMLDELRLGDGYGELAARARRKRDFLQSLGMPDPGPHQAGLSALELRRWFFETRLGRRMPEEMEDCLEETGYPDRESLDRGIAREYIFWSNAGAVSKPPEK